ncbi:CRISPR-associated helicase Cas3' [Tissierella creatinini]|nr:CRISPR-associated helicase Cas3' [Tissierella creatinini]TJX64641.1 CRISPR-associated helicase Cas3' [Soehngenia saccharolytica]
MDGNWIGRIDDKTKKIQGLKTHLDNVSYYSSEFATKLNLAKLGRLMGLLHDMGKASKEFLDYIRRVVENSRSFSSEKIDHSTASSKYLFEVFKEPITDKRSQYRRMLLEMITIAMMGHHGGLMDFVDTKADSPYFNRIQKKLDNYDQVRSNYFIDLYSENQIYDCFEEAVDELIIFFEKGGISNNFERGMTIKFLHSCLIDADRLDAFRFSNKVEHYGQKAEFTKYKASLDKYNERFKSDSKINGMRKKISDDCAEAGKKSTGLYTLTIPTGGGKTLSSIRFALEHAIENDLERIVYIVPYLSIIEQNAEVIKEALGLKDELLEFHSNIINDVTNEDVGESYFQQILSERWDKPIIFTSMVQFLETFYDKKNGKRRRLHNLANSVIIYDECQAVPIHCTKLFIKAIQYLSKICNSTGLLMTATQPGFESIVDIKLETKKLIEDVDNLFKVFKRVNIINHTENIYKDQCEISGFVKDRMDEVNNLLFICNTKSAARKIYDELKLMYPDDNVVYLSTYLCAAHRKDVISDIKGKIIDSNVGGKKLICITTQLIEAGVDISFEEVIRSLSGLDSIVQAAGRCNRNGEVEIANVYVVRLEFEKLVNLPTIQSGQDATLKVIDDIANGKGSSDLLAEDNISRYFKYYYSDNKDLLDIEIDGNNYILDLLGANSFYGNTYSKKNADDILLCKQSFKTAEEAFYVIKNQGYSVIVPYEGGKEIIAELGSYQDIWQKKSVLRKSQLYTINIFDYEWQKLKQNDGIVATNIEGVYVLKSSFYDMNYGLDIDGFAEVDTDMYSF